MNTIPYNQDKLQYYNKLQTYYFNGQCPLPMFNDLGLQLATFTFIGSSITWIQYISDTYCYVVTSSMFCSKIHKDQIHTHTRQARQDCLHVRSIVHNSFKIDLK